MKSAFAELTLCRLREFFREPEAMFWVYGFPLLMILALGIAFRERPIEQVDVDIQSSPLADQVIQQLEGDERFEVRQNDEATCRARLRTGKTGVIVAIVNAEPPQYEYHFDPGKPGSLVARDLIDKTLQEAAGREDAIETRNREIKEPGSRYIDFLIPGLLGMSLMGGGLWGVGFVTVDMRIRKLLKRYVATPMRKSDFLASIMVSRLVFMIPEVLVILLMAWLAFGVVIYGNLFTVVFLIMLGATMFSGLGLLLASRAETLEAISGLMNLVMLPMWMLSGIFFSTDRFPDAVQPFIAILPLTPLINSMRSVMLEGATLGMLMTEMGIIVGWTIVSFAAALRWFRWT